MRIILMATDEFIYDRFKKEFEEFEGADIHFGVFEQLNNLDCLVSPANSFGLMDGGMDLAITNYFGEQLKERVQKYILDNYYGEQPIGTSFVISTNNKTIPLLAHTPTMRIPKDIRSTDNVYNAMRSTLIEASKRKDIETIAIPAFGYGSGKLRASTVAYQMAIAYKQVISDVNELNWNYARYLDYTIFKV